MEFIFNFLLWVAIAGAVSFVLNLIRGGTKSTDKGTYFVKFFDETHRETGIRAKRVMFRGRMPNDRDMDVSFALSAFDATDGENTCKPVFSLVPAAREPATICYQMSGDFGRVPKGSALADWIALGTIVPDLIQPAYSGNRKIRVVLRMFNSHNPPTIHGGLLRNQGELIFSESLSFNYEFKEKGYEEVHKHREEAQAISLKIGVAVAMADTGLDDREGEILKNWIVKGVSGYPGGEREKLKNVLNKALKEGFAEAKKGNLSLPGLVGRLSEIGDKKTKYDAVELCLDVMAADGVADPEEMSAIRNVAKSLDLDMDEIEKMREKVTLNLSTELTSEEGLESLVGIESSWSDDQKRRHLRSEFQKWSNRINSLPEGEERAAAQKILDNIAALRKKYG